MATKKKFLTLENGVVVNVTQLSDRDQLRAAAIFDPKVLDKAVAGRTSNADAIKLWTGNEDYLMYVVEQSCKLDSEMPQDDAWVRVLRRNHRAYNISLDDLDDPAYLASLYIRHVGMTTDEAIAAVTDAAMRTKSTASAKTAIVPGKKPSKASQAVIDVDADEDDED